MRELQPYEVRLLGPGDASVMRELLDCFGEAFDDPESYCAAQPDNRYLDELLSGGHFFALAAIVDERVVGGLAGYELRKFEQPRSELYIYDLAVLVPYRRRGIATALVERARRLARERGAWVLYVQADIDDDSAISLCSTLGSREDVLHFDILPE